MWFWFSNPFFLDWLYFLFGFGFWLSVRNGLYFVFGFGFFIYILFYIGYTPLFIWPPFFYFWHPPLASPVFLVTIDQFYFYQSSIRSSASAAAAAAPTASSRPRPRPRPRSSIDRRLFVPAKKCVRNYAKHMINAITTMIQVV